MKNMISLLSGSFSTMRSFSKLRFAVVLPPFLFALLFLLPFHSALASGGSGEGVDGSSRTFTSEHRKLLGQIFGVDQLHRLSGEKCTIADISISQGSSVPLPSGIPQFTVEINNVCASGCNISGIHVRCGWFSSATLVNPKTFKRLAYDDCLVNDGNSLINGGTISFVYANSFSYRLSVSSVVC